MWGGGKVEVMEKDEGGVVWMVEEEKDEEEKEDEEGEGENRGEGKVMACGI